MTDTGSRVRLNIALYAATVLCACAAILLGILMWNASNDRVEGGTDVAPGAGEDAGRGTVQAVSLASEEEQKRVAAQLEAASKMVNAFVNFSHDDADATIEAVKSMSTGEFLKQYSKGAADLKKLATKARSEMVSRVLWSGLVAGDDDSATVIVATSGTVKNKTTNFQEKALNHRIQIELVLEDGRWLTRDLQFVG